MAQSSTVTLYCKNEFCNNSNSLSESLKIQDAQIVKKYAWAKEYACDKCHARFYICSICQSSGEKPFLRVKQMLYCHSKKHSIEEIKESSTVFIQNKEPMQCSTSNSQITDMKRKGETNMMLLKNSKKVKNVSVHTKKPSLATNEEIQTMSEDNYDRKESYKYYKQNIGTDNGPSYLVGVANFEMDSAYCHMSMDETSIHLQMAKFIRTLSCNQRMTFASILSKVDKTQKKM